LKDVLKGCEILQNTKPKWDRSLNASFECILAFEEPLVIGLYVPLIRHLRSEWSVRAVDFYVMVRAHLAKLGRLIQPFSGNPQLVQRVTDLLGRFELEVHAPAETPAPTKKKAVKASARQKPRIQRATSPVSRSAAKSKLPLAKRTPPRPKAVVRKLEIPRRRARG